MNAGVENERIKNTQDRGEKQGIQHDGDVTLGMSWL